MMRIRYVFLWLILFIISSKVYSQTSIDSLRKAYTNQKGNEQIQTGLLLTAALEDEPGEMLRLSQEIQKKIPTKAQNTLLYAKVLKNVSDAWFFNDSLEKSNEFLLKSLDISENIQPRDELFLANQYNDLGMICTDLEKYSLADFYLNKALVLFKKLDIAKDIAASLSNLGSLYVAKGDYDKALSMFLETNELDKKSGIKRDQSSSLNNIGQMYVKLGKYDLGLEYYQRSLELLEEKDVSTKAIRYNNIGMAHQLKGQHVSALKWFEAALKIDIEEQNGLKIGVRKHNMANSHLALGDYTKAEHLLLETVEIFEKLQLNNRLSKVYGSLGEVYRKQKNFTKADEMFQKALIHSEQSDDLNGKEETYAKLYRFYKELGNSEKALLFYEKQNRAKDSIYTLTLMKEVEELQTRYEAEKKDAKIQFLSEDNQLKTELLQLRKRERNIATIGFVVTLFFLAGLYFMFTTVKQQRRELARQNLELEKLNQTQSQLFGIISHDLKNAFATFQSTIKIIEYHLQHKSPEKLTPLLPELRKNSQNLTDLLHNLLQWSALQIKGIQPEMELLQVKEEFHHLIEVYQHRALEKQIDLKTIVQDETVYCDRESFRLIFRNLLDNALKYTQNGTITLQAQRKEQQTLLTVTDTGFGIALENQAQLFSSEKPNLKVGTKGEKGTGLGLKLVAEHIKKNHGSIALKKSTSEGSEFLLTFTSEPKIQNI